MAIPNQNAALVGWGAEFDEVYTANVAVLDGTPAMATEFHDRFVAFRDAYIAAQSESTRSKSLIAQRQLAKAALLEYARMLYAQIQANIDVSDAMKVALGIVVPDRVRTPVELGEAAPAVVVESVFGREVKLTIRDAATMKRKKVHGAIGVCLYSFVGTTPPAATSGWVSEGNVTKSEVIVQFDEATVQPGDLVHFTACWYSRTGQTSSACTPVSARIGFEGAEPIAA
jgi:hypothetical protein